jgi:hypothetical protein
MRVGGVDPPRQLKTFIARAATSRTVTSEMIDRLIINIFTLSEMGIVSVGENAVAFVNDR